MAQFEERNAPAYEAVLRFDADTPVDQMRHTFDRALLGDAAIQLTILEATFDERVAALAANRAALCRAHDIRLVISELATNAMTLGIHHRTDIGLLDQAHAADADKSVIVAVYDTMDGFTDISDRPEGEHGWGQNITALVADACGSAQVIEDPAGKVVWAQFNPLVRGLNDTDERAA